MRRPSPFSRKVAVTGSSPSVSPVGYGLSLAHQCVWDSAKREAGEDAFEEDEDEMSLEPPWSDATSTLLDPAWALGVPDLFSGAEINTLLQGWKHRVADGHEDIAGAEES